MWTCRFNSDAQVNYYNEHEIEAMGSKYLPRKDEKVSLEEEADEAATQVLFFTATADAETRSG